jgi:hypothetical protein
MNDHLADSSWICQLERNSDVESMLQLIKEWA